MLLIIDQAVATPSALESGLGLSAYEAALRCRRGGLHFHGFFDEDTATRELERLRAQGLAVEPLPEAEVRIRPLLALSGEHGGGRLWVQTEEETEVTLAREDLLLVVRGPIARQYQAHSRARRPGAASLEEGYRIHLHRRFDPRPVEIDPANFEFGFAAAGSPRLEMDGWIEALGPSVPCDDGFRWVPPALGVAGPEPRTALSAVARLARASRTGGAAAGGETIILDNAAQFRFYSAWRGAIARRRSASSTP